MQKVKQDHSLASFIHIAYFARPSCLLTCALDTIGLLEEQFTSPTHAVSDHSGDGEAIGQKFATFLARHF